MNLHAFFKPGSRPLFCSFSLARGSFAALLSLLALTSFSDAESLRRPFWTEQAMFQVGDDLFFVGEASCAKSPEDARQHAFDRGVQELLNYAQARSAVGLEIATQMMVEEPDAPGCPKGTVTTWRLLRVDADKVAKLPKGTARQPFREDSSPQSPSNPKDLTPRLGMSNEEALARFGRPWSISIGQGGREAVWNYKRFGLTLWFDQDNFLKRWRLARPQGHSQIAEETSARPDPSVTRKPALSDSTDLTARLLELEKEHPSSGGFGIMHNKRGSQVPPAPDIQQATSLPAPPAAPALASFPFTSRKQSVPGLAIVRINTNPYVDRFMTRYYCEILSYSLSVRHIADGSGPAISLDHVMGDGVESEIRTAITAGAKAVGYDPRYLAVRLTAPVDASALKTFGPESTVQATGADIAWAVTAAAVILGDGLRSDISMLGTVDPHLQVAPIDDLGDKMRGCRRSTPLELIISAHQGSLDVALSQAGMGIRVTPVNTFAEAYQVATGQTLRAAR